MSAHTPGPWQVIGEDALPASDDLMIVAFDISGDNEGADGIYVCNVGSDGGRYGSVAPVAAESWWPVSLANARLIAAAPDLLAAAYDTRAILMLAPASLPGWEETVGKLCAAIAKAEGR